MSEYPYDPFAYLPPERGFVARAQNAWFSMRHSVLKRLSGLKSSLSSWWNRGKYEPLVSFDPLTGQPVLAGVPESINFCRTRHRRATICWLIDRSSGTCRPFQARNVLIAAGKRIEVSEPRRPSDSGHGWIWGRFEITAEDVALIDDPAAAGPKYDPDTDPEATRLEKLLARSPRFCAAVADPHCARVAFLMLRDLEWFNVRDGDTETGLSGSIAAMIAGVRDRGERYVEYKYGTSTVGIPDADVHRYTLEVHDIMGELGWRTHTAEELRLKARADFNNRVEERIVKWHSLTELEARATDCYEPTGGRYAEIPMLIYEGEAAWAEQLPPDTQLMMSKEYARRVRHLVATNRISDDEYRTLTGLTC